VQAPGKTQRPRVAGRKKARFYRLFLRRPYTETKVIAGHKNGAGRHRMPQKIARGAGGPGALIKGLGPALPLAEALVERARRGRPGTACLDAIGALAALIPRAAWAGTRVHAGQFHRAAGPAAPPWCRSAGGGPAPTVFAAFCRLGGRIKRPKGAVPVPNSRRAKPSAFGYRTPGLAAIRAPQKRAGTAPAENAG
jgi:hypothetical protein